MLYVPDKFSGIENTKKVFQLHIQGKSSKEIADICNMQLKAVEEILK